MAAAKKAEPAPRKTYSLVQAAAILEVHRNTLAKWLDQGAPAATRADRSRGVEWELSVADIVDWRVKRAVDDAVASYEGEGGEITTEEAKRRKAVAEAIVAEIEADEALKRVVAVADVADLVAAEYAAVRSHLQAVGAKIAGRAASMTNPAEIQELVDAAILEALEAMQHDRRLAAA